MAKVRVALIGAGSRGFDVYGRYALEYPYIMEFVGIAEPNEIRRNKFSELHHIEEDFQFSSWQDLFSIPKFCDAVLIAAPDNLHYEPAMKAIELGYKILLEKPISNHIEECVRLKKQAEESKASLSVCHVLRYTPFFSNIKELIEEGKIGEVVSIQHNENVAYWHQAHSFVRGNWHSSKESSPMILAKCCHDMDILSWLIGKKCLKISSFGSLKHFRPENAPENSTLKCTDGCPAESDCCYSALKIYLGKDGWPTNVVSQDTRSEAVLDALKNGPYGNCVYKCNNDVVDHQVVNMLFEDGITVAFTMCAFTKDCTRTIKIMGTKGEIRGAMEKNTIEVLDFLSGNTQTISVTTEGGHSGGDESILKKFTESVYRGENEKTLTDISLSLQSHLMAFAAEKSRLSGKIIDLAEFEREILSNIDK